VTENRRHSLGKAARQVSAVLVKQASGDERVSVEKKDLNSTMREIVFAKQIVGLTKSVETEEKCANMKSEVSTVAINMLVQIQEPFSMSVSNLIFFLRFKIVAKLWC
jgi:hypothetical protein